MEETTVKTILVTGATDGIGLQTAIGLAAQGHAMVLHGRNAERGRAALEAVRSRAQIEPQLLLADFSSLAGVEALARAVQERFERLDVLVNNAGVYMATRQLTPDGLETTFAVNHMAPFLLTQLLLPLLALSAQTDSSSVRIVNVASATHHSITSLDFDNLQGEKSYEGRHAYAQSKLGNLLFTYELARRIGQAPITVNALHPGAINTKLLRAGFRSVGATPEEGAETSMYLATSPEVEGQSGGYYVDRQPAASSPLSYDPQLQATFWEHSENLLR